MSKFKAGDKVKVLGSPDENADIEEMIGQVCEVARYDLADGTYAVFNLKQTDYWWFRERDLELATRASAQRFTLIEFNEDTLVIDLGNNDVLGTITFSDRDESDWYSQIAPAHEFLDEDDAPNVAKLLKVLGYEYEKLPVWRHRLIRGAMRSAQQAEDYAKAPAGTPATWFETAFRNAPNLMVAEPISGSGCMFDGALGDPHNNKRLCDLAVSYGMSLTSDTSELLAASNHDNELQLEALAEEALDYLNEYAVAQGFTLEWVEGDLMLSCLDDFTKEEPF